MMMMMMVKSLSCALAHRRTEDAECPLAENLGSQRADSRAGMRIPSAAPQARPAAAPLVEPAGRHVEDRQESPGEHNVKAHDEAVLAQGLEH